MPEITDIQWNLRVKKVCVIVSSSRSGSTVFKSVLSKHPDIVSLDGELEPLFVQTKNGFPFTSDSDAISKLHNLPQLLKLLKDYLRVPAQVMCSQEEIKKRWNERLNLQFPDLQLKLNEALKDINLDSLQETDMHNTILNEVFKNEKWNISYYDGYFDKEDFRSFDFDKIEEPPFVTPTLCSRRLEESDFDNKMFLFKTPQDAYRIGIYEQLFPNAEIKYIHLTRGFAQTVNGLMDGWLSPVGFFAHDVSKQGIKLQIKGYSDKVNFGNKWWKFDMPPNWKDFIDSNLIEVCLNQWLSAHTAILESPIQKKQILFENFLLESSDVLEDVMDYLSLSHINIAEMPVTMATEHPKEMRWLNRKEELIIIAQRENVRKMMYELGYTMDPNTWV